MTTDWCESPLNYIPKIPRLFRNLVYTSPITMSIAVTRKNSSTIITSAVTKVIRYICSNRDGLGVPEIWVFRSSTLKHHEILKNFEGKMKKKTFFILHSIQPISRKLNFWGYRHITIYISSNSPSIYYFNVCR